MSRSSTRIGAVGLAVAALAGSILLSPTAAVAVAADRPALLITQQNGFVLSLPGDTNVPTTVARVAGGQAVDAAVAPDGDLWIAAVGRVYRVPVDGSPTVSYGGYSFAFGVVVGDDGTVYVSDNSSGIYTQAEDAKAPSLLTSAPGVAGISLDSSGNILAANLSLGTISRITPEGDTTVVASDVSEPVDAVETPDKSIVASEINTGLIKIIPAGGGASQTITDIGTGAWGLAAGDDGTVYVNNFNDTMTTYSLDPEIGRLDALATGLETPTGLSLDTRAQEQDITFTSTPPTDATVGDTYTPTATGGGSGNPVTFSIADSAAEVCSIDAETDEVTFDAPGTCTIAADQAGGTVNDVDYADAERATQDVVVNVPELFISSQVTSELPANEAGWYRTPATITHTCGGGSAPLDCPGPVTRANTQADFRAFAKVTDAEGRIARARTPMKVDTTTPQLTITTTGSGPYARTARPIRCTATDKHSGIDDTCTVTYGRVTQGPNGGATRRWTASATDIAGNTKTVSKAFRIKG